MENNQIGLALQDSLGSLKSYLDNQVKYNKLMLTEKLGDITSYFALLFIVSALAGGLLLFMSFAFVYWFASMTELNVYVGYLIIALFYTLLIVLIIRYREKLLFKPIRNILGSILFDETISDGDENPFNNKEDLKQKMKEVKTEIHQQNEELKIKFNDLGESLTFANISQQIFRSAYNSLVTSGNIARITFLLIKKLKRRSSKDKNKKAPQ